MLQDPPVHKVHKVPKEPLELKELQVLPRHRVLTLGLQLEETVVEHVFPTPAVIILTVVPPTVDVLFIPIQHVRIVEH